MRFANSFSLILFVFLARPAIAVPETALENAFDFLVASQNADGGFATDTEIANTEQATHEALIAFSMQGTLDSVDSAAALNLLDHARTHSLEYQARYLQSLRAAYRPIALPPMLIDMQNMDGGFGSRPGHSSTPLATAYALSALVAVDESGPVIDAALNWLLLAQQPSGAWKMHGIPSETVTALAIKALWFFRHRSASSEAIERAQQWLLEQRSSNGLWKDVETSVLVLEALASTLRDKTVLDDSREELLSLQQADGRWGWGVFETALAVQTLLLMEKPPADQISVSGQVIDLDSGAPVAARVVLSGATEQQLLTGNSGYFEFHFFEDGNYRLEVAAPGYTTQSYQLVLSPGDIRDLGEILLARGIVSPETATISGTVRDKLTDLAVSGAQVSVADRQVTADEDGRYQLSSLLPGQVTVNISAEGYLPVVANLDLQPGQILDLSPRLVTGSSQLTTINGIVRDAATATALADAHVVVQTVSGEMESMTGSDGIFHFESVMPGNITLRIEKAGYEEFSTNWLTAPGVIYEIPVPLARDTDSTDPGTVTGTVRDKDDNTPVPSAVITVGSLQVITDDGGFYRLDAVPPGETTVTVTAAGYLQAIATFELLPGQTVNLSPLLTRGSEQSATVEGSVTDSITAARLEDARLLLTIASGDIEQYADENGNFVFEGLEPGPAMLRIEKDGYQPRVADWEMQAGAVYEFPVQLVPLEEDPPAPVETRVAGAVLSSVNGTPLGSTLVQIYNAGAWARNVYTDIEGRFVVTDLHGDLRFSFSRSGHYSQTIEMRVPEGANVDLGQIEMRASNIGESGLRGRVLDGRTDQPLSGATARIHYNNTYVTIYTNAQGEFARNHIPAGPVRLELSRTNYASKEMHANTEAGEILDIGEVYLRPVDEQDIRPDLVVREFSQADLVSDPHTLRISGTVNAVIANSGMSEAVGGVRVIAFHDADANRNFDGDEQLLAEEDISLALLPDETMSVALEVDAIGAFRDVPVSVFVDADNHVLEALELNNTASGAGRCTGTGGSVIDLAMCLDASGSVSSANFRLQTDGTAAAIENPEIIPHDGRVRLSVFRFASGTSVELPPTTITSENAAELAEIVRAIPYTGGGTAIHSCVNVATDHLAAASPVADYQVIDVSTDGGSSYALAMQSSERAYSMGVDAINALAVGSGADLNLLNDMVFPQPAGGESGFVIAINSYQQYADAIATKVRRETSTADLTVGKPSLTEDGGQVALMVRVGNAGNRTVPAGVSIAVFDNGEEVGRAVLPELSESGYLDVVVPLDRVPLAGQTLTILVDPDAVIAECSRLNNSVTLTAMGTQAALEIAPASAVFQADEQAGFHAGITNTGLVEGTFEARLWIEDMTGQRVAELGGSGFVPLAAGANSTFSFDWNTGHTLAGHYRVSGELYSLAEERIDAAAALFEIRHSQGSPLADIRVTADRPVYHVTDRASLQLLARNLSGNTVIESAAVRVSLLRADGSMLAQQVHALGNLAPGALRELASSTEWNDELPGSISVVAEILDADDDVLASASTSLAVQEALALTLSGFIDVEHEVLPRGLPQSCHWQLRYDGQQSDISLPVRVSAVSLDAGVALEQHEHELSLHTGEAVSDVDTVHTRGWPEGMAACVLEAEIEDAWQQIAHSVFRVDPPPIEIAASLQSGVRGRVLVLLDAGCDPDGSSSSCNSEPYGPSGAPPLDIQRSHVQAVLESAGWRYTVVTNAADFETEFRTRGYEIYALFNEALKLPEALQQDVVADIATGRGLLVSGNHDRRNGRLEEALGIKSLGKNLDVQALVVQPFGSHEGGELALAVTQRPNALKLQGAEVLGEFRVQPKGNNPPEMEPALTQHSHGEGGGVYAGYDWLVQGAMEGDDGAFADLLVTTLQTLQKQPYLPVAGRIFPLQVTLENQGIGVEGEVHLALPPGVLVAEGPDGIVAQDGIAIWPYALIEHELKAFTLWLRLPEVTGPVTFAVAVYAEDELDEYAHAELTLEVQDD